MQGDAEYDERLMTLVESALARPRGEREAFLRATCESDGPLYAEARSRVEWEERMGGFLLDPILQTAFEGFAPGELVAGRFRIVRELGRGGMGQVYEAYDERLNRRVAVKLASSGFQDRLSPEARAALEVSHPNVCKIHEIHTAKAGDREVEFLTMEFIEGETLAALIAREGPLSGKEARQIALQLCSGLAQAHRQGVIHGDIKAGNVMISRTSEGLIRAVLTDFGLARIGLGETGAEGGTPAYMAPELLAGARPTIASDLYAFGVLLHVLIIGRTPDETHAAPLPPPWQRVIPRSLETNPNDRFGSADEIARVLSARPAVTRWLLAAAMAVIVALGFTLWSNRVDPGPPVRLAVLPIDARDAGLDAAVAVGADIADRLNGLRSQFTVIPPADAVRRQAQTPEKARSILHATHVLRTRVRRSGARMAVEAWLTDADSGQVLRELRGEYNLNDSSALAKALTATVTRNFGLHSNATREAVSAAAYPFYLKGVQLLQGDPQTAPEAIPHFKKAIELDPKSALPWARLAQAQVQVFRLRGQGLEEAGESVVRAKSLNPDSVPVLVASAAYLQMYGKYEQATEELSRATQLEPSDSEVWRRLGALLQRSNHPNEAANALRKAVEVQPGEYMNYVSLGAFHFARNEYPQAEEVFRRAVSLDPSVSAAHMNLGLALLAQGRFSEAEKLLLTALSLRRTSVVLMNLGTLHYEQERYDAALHWYEQAIAAGNATATRYRALGDAYRRLGQTGKAARAYRKAMSEAEEELNRNSRSAEMRGLVGLMCARLGERRRAQAELHQALAMEPENALLMRDVAIGWETLGMPDQTYEAVRRAPFFLLEQLNRHPDLRALQKDGRFQALLADAQAERPIPKGATP